MQFGGGAGAAGAAAAAPPAPTDGGEGGGGGGGDGGSPVQTQQINLSVSGSRFSQNDIRDLIADINEALGDNTTLQAG